MTFFVSNRKMLYGGIINMLFQCYTWSGQLSSRNSLVGYFHVVYDLMISVICVVIRAPQTPVCEFIMLKSVSVVVSLVGSFSG